MAKVEITDEMVGIARDVLDEGYVGDGRYALTVDLVRKALDHAINPPPEPEIVVTEEMY